MPLPSSGARPPCVWEAPWRQVALHVDGGVPGAPRIAPAQLRRLARRGRHRVDCPTLWRAVEGAQAPAKRGQHAELQVGGGGGRDGRAAHDRQHRRVQAAEGHGFQVLGCQQHAGQRQRSQPAPAVRQRPRRAAQPAQGGAASVSPAVAHSVLLACSVSRPAPVLPCSTCSAWSGLTCIVRHHMQYMACAALLPLYEPPAFNAARIEACGQSETAHVRLTARMLGHHSCVLLTCTLYYQGPPAHARQPGRAPVSERHTRDRRVRRAGGHGWRREPERRARQRGGRREQARVAGARAGQRADLGVRGGQAAQVARAGGHRHGPKAKLGGRLPELRAERAPPSVPAR